MLSSGNLLRWTLSWTLVLYDTCGNKGSRVASGVSSAAYGDMPGQEEDRGVGLPAKSGCVRLSGTAPMRARLVSLFGVCLRPNIFRISCCLTFHWRSRTKNVVAIVRDRDWKEGISLWQNPSYHKQMFMVQWARESCHLRTHEH